MTLFDWFLPKYTIADWVKPAPWIITMAPPDKGPDLWKMPVTTFGRPRDFNDGIGRTVICVGPDDGVVRRRACDRSGCRACLISKCLGGIEDRYVLAVG